MAFPYIAGGLSTDPLFVSEFAEATPTIISQQQPQSTIITGEDGNRYYIAGGNSGVGGDSDTLHMYDADTGTEAFTYSESDMQTDADDAGVTTVPINNSLGRSNFNYLAACAIPETPYFIAIGGGSGGTTSSKRVLYYKINSSGDPEFVGGYAGLADSASQVQFAPPQSAGDAIVASGFVPSSSTSGDNNNIQYIYPIAVAYYGETRSTVVVVPSINYIIANTPIVEDVPKSTGNWVTKESNIGTVFGDSEVLNVGDFVPTSSRGFFLPRPSSGGRFIIPFYKSTLDAVNAGTESVSSSYLDTYAPLYPNGLISSIDLSLSTNLSPFGFSVSLGSVTPAFHSIIKDLNFSTAFPFADAEEDYDGSAGTSDDNYYSAPTTYPSDLTDPTAPWFVFFPRIYRSSGDRDKIGVRVCAYDPVEDVMYDLAFAKDQIYDIGVDVDSDTNPSSASVWWDRSTGRLDVLVRSTATGERSWIVSRFGTFSPVTATSTSSEELLTRAWGFELDSHSFYVMRLGQQGTFVFDLLTMQWSQWQTQGFEIWNAVHGIPKWDGIIFAGDIEDGKLWKIDPDATLDEDTKPITRTVTGILPNRERAPQRLMELRVSGSVGAPYLDGAGVSLTWSDDQGQTYSSPITVNLVDGDNEQVIRFRSLGRFDSPLRIFDITDVGGLVRINGADVEIK